MKIELNWNCLEGTWWYSVGIGLSKTEYHPKYKNVLTVELLIASIYVRW